MGQVLGAPPATRRGGPAPPVGGGPPPPPLWVLWWCLRMLRRCASLTHFMTCMVVYVFSPSQLCVPALPAHDVWTVKPATMHYSRRARLNSFSGNSASSPGRTPLICPLHNFELNRGHAIHGWPEPCGGITLNAA